MKRKVNLGLSILAVFVNMNFVFAQDTLRCKIKTLNRVVVINVSVDSVFTFMDDIQNTGGHMTKSNAPMMGSKLSVEWLTDYKTGLGSKYRWSGKVMGMKMDFTVEITKWVQNKEKIWETVGEAKMIVLSWYRMYLVLTPLENGTTQTELGIFYTKPKGSFLSFLLSRRYAVWCVKSMIRDTQKHFEIK